MGMKGKDKEGGLGKKGGKRGDREGEGGEKSWSQEIFRILFPKHSLPIRLMHIF